MPDPSPAEPPARPIGALRLAWRLLRRPSRFALVGAGGLVVNQLAMALFTETAGIWYGVSALLATACSTTFNFSLVETWVFPGRRHGRTRRFAAFATLNLASNFLTRLPLLLLLTEGAGAHYLAANMVALSVTFGFRYLVAENWIWAGRDRRPQPEIEGWYNYRIHELLTIRSQVALSELALFAVPRTLSDADLTIRRRVFLGGRPNAHATRIERSGPTIRYTESLGGFGAAFEMEELDGGRFEIRANWLLITSSHVLYTNLVEPLVRFVLAERGFMLLHGASLESGSGIVLTAPTDTGKTGTVIRLLAARKAAFLGDDMVIVSPDGGLRSYPKPMTVSYHTIRHLPVTRSFSRSDELMLQIRSRLHSRTGRGIGLALARLPLPIVTMSALVQALVPPPKYFADSLVEDVRRVGEASLRHVVILAKGDPEVRAAAPDETLEALLANTEDAYSFPPFADLERVLTVRGHDVHELRERERETLRSALVRAERLSVAVDDYSWPERIAAALGLVRVA